MLFNRYDFAKILRDWRYAVVYRALRHADQVPVILRILDERAPANIIAYYRREFAILHDLSSSRVVRPCSIINVPHRIIFETIDCGEHACSAASLVGTLSLDDFLTFAIEIARAARDMHAEGITHAALSPKSILYIPKTQEIFLKDFGVAFRKRDDTPAALDNRILTYVLPYVSPELTGRINRHADHRSDLYSLGAILYELASGQPPFSHSSPVELIHSHIAHQPTPLSILADIPPMISNIIATLLAKDPEDRYQSAQHLEHDLVAAQKRLRSSLLSEHSSSTPDRRLPAFTPSTLYGRTKEMKTFIKALQSAKSSRLLLLSAPQGAGKTSLLNEAKNTLSAHEGLCFVVDFDKPRNTQPYGGFLGALDAYCGKQLASSDISLENLKYSLLHALGEDAQILVNFLPNLEAILGIPREPYEADFHKNLSSLASACQKIFVGLCGQRATLVLLLDNIEGADQKSIALLCSLLSIAESLPILTIATTSHPCDSNSGSSVEAFLHKNFQRYNVRNVPVRTLILKDLSKTQTINLVADALSSSTTSITPLASLLHTKTHGNPFFTIELLKTLYQQDLVRFDSQSACWTWDIQAIQKTKYSDNVVDLMIRRIRYLSPDTRCLLEAAACLEDNFEIRTIATACSLSSQEAMSSLQPAIDDGVIHRVVFPDEKQRSFQSESPPDKFYFPYSRIRQAILKALPVEQRADIQLRIAHSLLKQSTDSTDNSAFIPIANLLCATISPSSQIDPVLLARINLKAAYALEEKGMLSEALNYVQVGIEGTSASFWKSQRSLMFALHLALYRYESLTENKNADQTMALCFQHVKTLAEKFDLSLAALDHLSAQSRMQEAFVIGRDILQEMHLPLPEGDELCAAIEAERNLLHQHKRKIFSKKFLHKGWAKNNHAEKIGRILVRLIGPVFFTSRLLYLYITMKAVNLSLRYGFFENAAEAYSDLSYIFACEGNYTEARNHGQFAQALVQTYSMRDANTSLSYAISVAYWHKPISMALDYSRQAQRIYQEEGDPAYLPLTFLLNVKFMLIQGHSLHEVLEECQKGITAARYTENTLIEKILSIFTLACHVLQGKKPVKHLFNLQQKEENSPPKDGSSLFVAASYLAFFRLMISYLVEDYATSLHIIRKHASDLEHLKASTLYPEFIFYHFATLVSLCAKLPRNKQDDYRQEMAPLLAKLEYWSVLNPASFRHKYLLAQAGMARLNNDTAQAAPLYREAATLAHANDFLNVYALAHIREGIFWREQKDTFHAVAHMRAAIEVYRRCGNELLADKAWNRLKRMSSRQFLLPDFLDPFTPLRQPIGKDDSHPEVPYSLDLHSILTASQALAEEIHFPTLLSKILQIATKSVGAETAFLFLNRNDLWICEARASGEVNDTLTHTAVELGALNDLAVPKSVIYYAARTRQSFILGDPRVTSNFAKDRYLQEVKPRSALCTPITKKGIPIGILYLENRLTSNVFTEKSLDLLKILTAQIAISIENSTLYGQLEEYSRTLEQKVAERTAQLNFLAHHDPLTKLLNRHFFNERLNQALSRAERLGSRIALMFIDLDDFKQANDSFGHEIGDIILQNVAQILKTTLREHDAIFRMGGDEFAVLIEDISDKEKTLPIMEKLIARISAPMPIRAITPRIGCSIGVSFYPEDGQTARTLLHNADTAMYEAKSSGKNRFVIYNATTIDDMSQRKKIEDFIQDALTNNLFWLDYQPLISLHSRNIVAIETLLRWPTNEGVEISSEQLRAIISETDLSIPINTCRLDLACRQLVKWKNSGLKSPPLVVKISPQQLARKTTAYEIMSTVLKHGLTSSQIILEHQEAPFSKENPQVMVSLRTLRELGFRCTLNSHEMNHTLFETLTAFPIDTLKISSRIVQDLPNSREGIEIIIAIAAVAYSRNIDVIINGVRSLPQIHCLEEIDPTLIVQGDCLGPILGESEMNQRLTDSRHS